MTDNSKYNPKSKALFNRCVRCDHVLPEKNYFKKKQSYYKNIHIGVNYHELNYEKCVSFLLMLQESLKIKD